MELGDRIRALSDKAKAQLMPLVQGYMKEIGVDGNTALELAVKHLESNNSDNNSKDFR